MADPEIKTIFDAPGDDEQEPEDSVMGSKYQAEETQE